MEYNTDMTMTKTDELPVTKEYIEGLLKRSDGFTIEPMTPPHRGRKQVYQITVMGLIFVAYKQRKLKFLDWTWYAE
jgi:hypothetical protein